MPADMALWSFVYGAGFGLLPVGWTIFCAMLLYNITVETGQFTIIRRSVASLSGDARIQAVLIGFSFGAFLEGAAGGGTPVAICGAIMVGLGFNPFLTPTGFNVGFNPFLGAHQFSAFSPFLNTGFSTQPFMFPSSGTSLGGGF